MKRVRKIKEGYKVLANGKWYKVNFDEKNRLVIEGFVLSKELNEIKSILEEEKVGGKDE